MSPNPPWPACTTSGTPDTSIIWPSVARKVSSPPRPVIRARPSGKKVIAQGSSSSAISSITNGRPSAPVPGALVVDVPVGADVPTGVSLDDGVTAQPPSRATTATASPHGVLMSGNVPSRVRRPQRKSSLSTPGHPNALPSATASAAADQAKGRSSLGLRFRQPSPSPLPDCADLRVYLVIDVL